MYMKEMRTLDELEDDMSKDRMDHTNEDQLTPSPVLLEIAPPTQRIKLENALLLPAQKNFEESKPFDASTNQM